MILQKEFWWCFHLNSDQFQMIFPFQFLLQCWNKYLNIFLRILIFVFNSLTFSESACYSNILVRIFRKNLVGKFLNSWKTETNQMELLQSQVQTERDGTFYIDYWRCEIDLNLLGIILADREWLYAFHQLWKVSGGGGWWVVHWDYSVRSAPFAFEFRPWELSLEIFWPKLCLLGDLNLNSAMLNGKLY